ncbi:MAG TPA: tricarballylate utilization 4Fe-4S protein TcuB [Candidatus Dormibacteraeota bacterium]|nr:tricarballylate utilization 4Fe-4S protein TcuB [Candidatus Dormibacteraeota bacterium]
MISGLEEARRQLAVCDACRYCEGYCAVFPALERRSGRLLLAGDVAQLANLCHDCRACYQACPFTPPHEFAVDIPGLLGAARAESYERFAWPSRTGRWAFRHPSLAVAGATGLGLALALAVAGVGGGLLGRHTFYEVVPYLAMLVPALVVSAFVVAVLAAGFARFWRAGGGGWPSGRAWLVAAREALGLRWLRGGGGGCYYPDPERPSGARRVLHSLVVGGLALAFAATVAAALLQDVLGVPPPYPVLSAPVVLGSLGGAALIAGCAGLLVLAPAGGRPRALESAFLWALLLAAITGMLTLALRATPALGPALVVHLGALAGLYVTAPYGKLVHGVYRFAALLRDAGQR